MKQDQYRAELLEVDERLAGLTTAGETSGGLMNHAAGVLERPVFY